MNDLEKKDTQYNVQECISAAQMVQAAIKVNDSPAGLASLLGKLSTLYDALEKLDLSNHAKRVEAAYREGWKDGYEAGDGPVMVGDDDDWEASDAKAALEGGE